jgi:ABC-type phosphate transport system auxiliary subunit
VTVVLVMTIALGTAAAHLGRKAFDTAPFVEFVTEPTEDAEDVGGELYRAVSAKMGELGKTG